MYEFHGDGSAMGVARKRIGRLVAHVGRAHADVHGWVAINESVEAVDTGRPRGRAPRCSVDPMNLKRRERIGRRNGRYARPPVFVISKSAMTEARTLRQGRPS